MCEDRNQYGVGVGSRIESLTVLARASPLLDGIGGAFCQHAVFSFAFVQVMDGSYLCTYLFFFFFPFLFSFFFFPFEKMGKLHHK